MTVQCEGYKCCRRGGLIAFLVACLAPVAAAAPLPESIVRTGDIFQALAADIPEPLYSEEGLIESLGYDVTAAANFVRDEIGYEPYEGVLRGPEGVIATGGGSSWDQAVLAASLINGMGGEAMLVRGELTADDADRLLALSGVGHKPFSAPLEAETVLAAFDGVLPPAAMEEARVTASEPSPEAIDVSVSAAAIADAIVETAQSENLAFGENGESHFESLRDRLASEYVWVRYRDTPADPWTELHPAFGGKADPEVQPQEYLDGRVPDERLHRIELKLEIERTGGDGKPERTSVMNPYERPAANLASAQVPIGIAPSEPVTTGEVPDFFVPVLFGETAPGAQVFNAFGLSASADDALAGPGVFAEVAGKLALGTGALGGGDPPQLLGVILTVTHIAPGGGRTHEERRIVDVRGVNRDMLVSRVPVDGVIDIGIGRENGAREMHAVLSAQPGRLRVTGVLADVVIRRDEVDARELASRIGDPQHAGWPGMVLRGGALEPDLQESRTFRTGPLVTMRRIRPGVPGDGFSTVLIDVLHNPVLSLAEDGTGLDPLAALRQGVRETMLEGVVIGEADKTPWINREMDAVLTSKEAVSSFAEQAGLQATVRERMLADQAQSGWIIIADAGDASHWWRVDPVTGQGLGMGVHGGQSAVEHIISMTAAAYGWYSTIASYQGCEDTFPENDKMYLCCLGANSVMFGMGNAAGKGVGSYIDNHISSTVGWVMSTLTFEGHMYVFDKISGLGIDSACRAAFK